MRYSLVVTILATYQLVLCSPASSNRQTPLSDHSTYPVASDYAVDDSILAALEIHEDPVAALLSLQPELTNELSQKRLLRIFGQDEPEWVTEGDKMRLKRKGKKFMDITDHDEFYQEQVNALAGKASEWIERPYRALLILLQTCRL